MNTITEAELKDNAQNGAVSFIKAARSPDGEGFNLFVNLVWKEGDLLLITQQKKPRTWASVDRLLAHIDRHYSEVASLTIYLAKGKVHESSS